MDRRERDERLMERCLELARRAEGRTAPNPLVGCVITDRRGRVLAEGWHRRAGEPHAEAEALAVLGGRAKGATMYVNLEPCAHLENRRTEPCAPKVAESGIARLVVGMRDPIRSHAGGARWLAKQGIDVEVGVLKEACRELNRAFITRVERKRPWITLKAAVTLDGRVATRTGDSQWITGKDARRDGHQLRDRRDAMIVGIGTVVADDPRMTVRGIRGGRDPIRVVVDSRLRTPPEARLLPANTRSRARTIIAAADRAPRARERRLADAGAEIWRLPAPDGRVDLAALVQRLADAELTSVLVEGGAALHAAVIEADLADELVLYLAPLVFGGAAPAWVQGQGAALIADAPRFRLHGEPRSLGPDLALIYRRR